MTPDQFLVLLEHGGLLTAFVYLWWIERKERLKLSDRVDKCFEERVDDLRDVANLDDDLRP